MTSSPRRILLLITDLELGGTPIVVRELATRLSPFAHVEVACLKPAGVVGEQLRERGIAVTSFGARRSYQIRDAIRQLVELVRDRSIDTVFSFLIHANLVAARAGRRLPDVRFLQSIQTTQPRPRWHWWLQSHVHHAAARVVVPSESVARRAIERSRVPAAKLVVIPNAVDVAAFASVARVPASPDVFRVGFVGRLDPVKRVGDLLDAVATLPASARLDLFGDGAELPAITRAIARTPTLVDRVTLHGAIGDARHAYATIDALVLPSEAEGFGLVLIEAMAAGVPVIGTDVDGIRDVVAHERTGLLAPVADPPALAAAIRRLIDDGALRDRLVVAARDDVAKRFAWDAVIARYRDVLRI